MTERIRILLVDDDEDEYLLTQNRLSDLSSHTGQFDQTYYDLDWVDSYQAALEKMEKEDHDVYLVDYHLGERNGLELVQAAAELDCQAPIILMTGQGSYSVDVEAMKAGVMDYLAKAEVTPTLLERTIRYAIERKRAEDKIRKNAARSHLLASLSQAFVGAGLYYPAVLSTIAHQIAESTLDACIIRLISDDGLWLDPVAFHHSDPQILASMRDLLAAYRMEVTSGPDGRSLQTGSPLISLFFQDHGPDSQEMLSRWFGTDFHCGLFVPLHVKDRPIGTLSVLRSNPRAPYTQEDAAFFQDLSDRAALSIENARLYVEEAQRVREQDALQVATAALLSTIDLETLLSRILDIAQSAIPAADLAMLHLAPRQNYESQVLAASSDKDLRIRKAQFPRSQRHLSQVVRDYLPALIQDMNKGPDLAALGLPIELENARSAVVAPLILGDEVLGLLSLRSSRTAAFVDADKRLLMSFANTTTAALQNAMLHAEVQRLAMTDSLTNVYNRRGFFEFGRREIERAARFGRPVSALMVDVDYFKEINDTYGHTEGDHVLRILAGRLRSIIREIDVLGRYGGDEFVILLPETDTETACIVAERIRQRIAEPIVINEVNEAGQVELSMTASLGVASQAATVQDINSLIKRADIAAYVAKQKGRNRVEID